MTPTEGPLSIPPAVEKVKYGKRPATAVRPAVYYPESDGEPMAETDVHRQQMIYLIEALTDYFRHDPQVYVAGNLLLYYAEGDPEQSVAPDVFVVFGVPGGNRRVYKLWEEGKGPDVVFELTSRGTMWKDLGPKKGIYEMLGVREYFLFDPLREYLEPPLQGYRLEDGTYRQVEGEQLGSQVLGLELQVEGEFLRLYDLKTGEKLLTPLEAQAARREAEALARREAEARQQAEAELERLRAELARLRGG